MCLIPGVIRPQVPAVLQGDFWRRIPVRRAGGEAAAAIASALPGSNPLDPEMATTPHVAFGAVVDGGPAPGRVVGCIRSDGLMITADVRLDDREALGAVLGLASGSDTACNDIDLVRRAYLRWGESCPRYLIGDYAFAIWDERERSLFCARDHIGARPFYHGRSRDHFVFASAIKGVLACPGLQPDVDEEFLRSHFEGVVFATTQRTFFRHVRRLPPGHTLTVRDGRETLQRYWSIDALPDVRMRRDADYVERLRELHGQAIADRLPRADPVGVHVSGGLDCSGIAVVAARQLQAAGRPRPRAYTWLPPSSTSTYPDDQSLVDAVATAAKLVVRPQQIGGEDVIRQLLQDGPAGMMTTGTLLHEAGVQADASADGVRVILSGWGGDEGVSFNGRGCLPQLLLAGRWRQLLDECRDTGRPWRTLAIEALLPFFDWPSAGTIARLLRRKPARRSLPSLLSADIAARVRPLPAVPFRPTSVRRAQRFVLDLGHLTDRIDEWTASGARHGIEYRYPLLDRRLMEFAYGLPPDLFRRGRHRRWIMRKAMEGILPPDVCWNERKDDPSRSDALNAALAAAIPALAGIVRARRATMERARYLDIDRLLDELDTDAYRADPRPSRLIKALQFLDLA